MEKVTLKEIDMIELYKNEPKEDIEMYFFNKYKDDLIKLLDYKMRDKFGSIPLEKGDLFYIVWRGIKNSLKSFDKNKSLNLFSLSKSNSYFLLLKEARKFISNGNIVLNNAISYHDNENLIVGKNKNLIEYINKNESFNKVLDNFMKMFDGKKEKFNLNLIKRLIYLKSLGFKASEIYKKLNINKKMYQGIIRYIRKIAKDWNY